MTPNTFKSWPGYLFIMWNNKYFSYFSAKAYVVGTQKSSMRVFWAPTAYFKIDGQEKIYNFTLKNFVYLNLWYKLTKFQECSSYSLWDILLTMYAWIKGNNSTIHCCKVMPSLLKYSTHQILLLDQILASHLGVMWRHELKAMNNVGNAM